MKTPLLNLQLKYRPRGASLIIILVQHLRKTDEKTQLKSESSRNFTPSHLIETEARGRLPLLRRGFWLSVFNRLFFDMLAVLLLWLSKVEEIWFFYKELLEVDAFIG